MPKNSKPNGFMVFTFDWKAKYGKNMKVAEATEAAGKIWQTMTTQERAPYNDRAKKEKANVKATGDKLTCTGTPLAFVEREKAELASRELKMKREIEAVVRTGVRTDTLATQKYYFMMINYFAKAPTGDLYVPAELSVSEFSLKEGIMRTYHAYINPAVNIYGHQFEAENHSKTTHMLPLPPNAMGETNLGAIYNNVLDFIYDKQTKEHQPVYTMDGYMNIVKSSLGYIRADIGSSSTKIKVSSLNYLFFILKEATAEIGEVEKPKSIFITDAYLERDIYEYNPNIACTYHENVDKSKYCSQSYVIRWGYMFADFMANDLALKLTPGRHMPAHINIHQNNSESIASRSNVAASVVSFGPSSTITQPLSEHEVFNEPATNTVDLNSTIGRADYSNDVSSWRGEDGAYGEDNNGRGGGSWRTVESRSNKSRLNSSTGSYGYGRGFFP